MGDNTGIQWTDATWNWFTGCSAVSPGCDRCYAASLASGRLAHVPAYAGLASGGKFNGKVRLLPDRLDQPLRWRRPRRIFVNSMSDAFHEGVADVHVAQTFAVMALAGWHQFQILTKRHGRMRSLLNSQDFDGLFEEAYVALAARYPRLANPEDAAPKLPLPNVWLGVSVEDQKRADLRIPALLATPAAVRFLSCEPLLGPINLIGQGGDLVGAGIYALPDPPERDDGEPVCQDHGAEDCQRTQPHAGCTFVDWVIVGGESGRGARPMAPDWARSLRDQCEAARVPFFMKQAGEVLAREWGCSDRKGHDPAEWPEPFPREFPHAA